MSGWGWVLWGYGVVFLAVAVYVWSLLVRTRRVERRLDELR